VETTTMDDVLAAGLPDPLYCKRGSADHARLLADLLDDDMGGTRSCGGSGGPDTSRISSRSRDDGIDDPELQELEKRKGLPGKPFP
jgi:hypothetical protein